MSTSIWRHTRATLDALDACARGAREENAVQPRRVATLLAAALALCACKQGSSEQANPPAVRPPSARTVFMIVMENKDWAHILRSERSARYIHQLIAGEAAYCANYRNRLGESRHPSEPNYITLEAGGTFGLDTDGVPGPRHCVRGVPHLSSLLTQRGMEWRSYQEGISGVGCPLKTGLHYAPRHNPVLYFDDVSSGADCSDHGSPVCERHVRPFEELTADLLHDRVGRYNFITPDLCNDMHDSCGGDAVQHGDAWLSHVVPLIQASPAYQRGGVIFITWDEGGEGSEPIGLIALSPDARRGELDCEGRTHDSLLRTVQRLLDVQPYLGAAASSRELSELFTTSPERPERLTFGARPPEAPLDDARLDGPSGALRWGLRCPPMPLGRTVVTRRAGARGQRAACLGGRAEGACAGGAAVSCAGTPTTEPRGPKRWPVGSN